MKQNLDESNCIQLFHKNSRVQVVDNKNLISHYMTSEFYLSLMPDLLDTDRIK